MTAEIYRTDKVDQNPPITAHEHDLLTPLAKRYFFSKRSTAVIDGSEKRNGWLNHELQSPRVIVIGPERPGKLMKSQKWSNVPGRFLLQVTSTGHCFNGI